MADDLPASFSSFDESRTPAPGSTGLPASFSSFDEKPISRRPEDVAAGTGLSGIPAAPASWADVGYSAMAGLHELGAAGAGLLGSVTDEEDRQNLQRIAREQMEAAEASRAQRTPTVQPGFRHPLVWAGEQAPSFAGMAGAEMLGGPLAVGGFMAAQSRGQLEARGAAEGYQPSQAELAVPTVTGFLAGALPGAGLPAKIATSPMARYAAGIGEGSIVFGAQAGVEEAVGQHIDISAGTRKDYDPGEIAGAALTGAEFGGAFAALHRPERAKPSTEIAAEDLGKKAIALHAEPEGGKNEAVRGGKGDERKEEAKVKAGAKPVVTPGVTGEGLEEIPGTGFARVKETGPPPPASPAADPAVAMAAKGEGAVPAAEAGTPPGEAAVAPVPEAPARAAPSEELQQQHLEMMDPKHPREAVLYPPDTEPMPITERKQRYGSTKLDDGSTLQYDRSGPSKINKTKIKDATDAGRLDEYVQGVTKEPAPKPEVAPAPLTQPEVPPVQEAPPRPLEAPPAAEAPSPATPIPAEARPPSEAVPEAPRAEPAVVEAPEPTTPDVVVPAGAAEAAMAPRVLEAAPTTEHERALLTGEKLKAKARAKAEAPAPAGKHRTKEELVKIEENNRKAKEVTDRHLPVEGETLDARRARAEAMLKDAKAAGVDIPTEFGRGTLHGPEAMLLNEAKALTKNKLSTIGQHSRFFDQEAMLRGKRMEEAVDVRRAEGAKELGSGGGRDEALGEEPKATEVGRRGVEAEGAEEEMARRQEAKEEQEAHEREAKAQREYEQKLEAGVPEAGKEEPAVRGFAAREAPTVTGRAKLAGLRPEIKGKISLEKKLALAKQEIPESERPSILTTNENRELTEIKPMSSTNVHDLVRSFFNVRNYSPELRPMMQRLVDRVAHIAGDMDVHFIPHEDMLGVGGNTRGYFDPNMGHIVLNADHLSHDTALHEAFHAATFHAIEEDPALKKAIEDVRQEINKQLEGTTPSEMVKYALSDAHEFLTGLMTNVEVQDTLKGIKISRGLADQLQIPKWRKATMWEGALSVIRRALGLGPRDTSAIEAAMSLTEYGLHKSMPGEAMQFAARWAKADMEERMTPRYQRMMDPAARQEDEARAGKRYMDMGMQAGQDALSNLRAGVSKYAPRFLNGPQLERYFGKMFSDEKGNIIGDALTIGRRKGVEMNKLREADHEMVSRAKINAQTYKTWQEGYSKLLDMSTRYQVDASKAPPAIKGKAFNRAMENWQGNAKWREANELYNSMPKALREQYLDEKKFYANKQKQMAEGYINTILDNHPLPAGVTRAEIWDRIKKGEMTDDDVEHYHNLKAIGEIREAQRLMGGKQVYFPAYRDGNYVVTGRYAMPDGGHDTDIGGTALADNKRQFDTRQEAHDYATATHMYASPEIVRYAKDTGERLTTALDREKAEDPSRGGRANVAERYEVTLQREHTEMRQSYAEAERAREDMKTNGVQDLSGVLDKRKEGDWGRINSEFSQAMERRIKDRDDLSADEKKATIEAAREYALVRRSALQSHLVHRRNVAGADYGHADAVRSYSEAANRHMVNTKYAPEMDAVMKRLEDQDNVNRNDPSISYQSSVVANEMRDRVYRSPDALSLKNSPVMHRLMQLSYLHWLVGPRHLLMMQSHPYVYSAPEMAGRHGAAAYRALHTAAKDLGGDLLGMRKGVGGTGRLAKSIFERDPEQAAKLGKIEDITEGMLSRLKGRELEAMRELVNTGELHSGFGDDFYSATGMGKVDAMIRQLTSAQDAQNRAVVGLSAYRLEFEKTGSQEKAINYSRRVIQDTIGVNSPMDMASAMKSPWARSFMQFKHFPLRQTELLVRNVYNAFRNSDPEVKREAWRAAAHQIMSSFAMSGVHGLPIGPLKVLGLAGYAMGVLPSPAQMDDRTRRWLAGVMGPTGANVMMDGVLSAIPHAPNLNNMFSRDLDMAFGEPRMTRTGPDWAGYAMGVVGGAPASTVFDTLRGVQAAGSDEWTTALSYMPTPRILSDIAKAYKLHEEGLVTASGKQLTPASDADAAWRMLGFGTQQAQRLQSGRAAAQADIQEAQAAKKATKAEQLKAQAKAKREKDIMGIPVSKQTKKLLQERQAVYQ